MANEAEIHARSERLEDADIQSLRKSLHGSTSHRKLALEAALALRRRDVP